MNEPRPKFLNNFRIRPQGIKNADKRTAILVESTSEEALMKTFAATRNSNEVPAKELTPAPKPVPVAKEVTPVEMQPTFTLTFTLGTRMRELHDTIIRTVLQYTRGNRLIVSCNSRIRVPSVKVRVKVG